MGGVEDALRVGQALARVDVAVEVRVREVRRERVRVEVTEDDEVVGPRGSGAEKAPRVVDVNVDPRVRVGLLRVELAPPGNEALLDLDAVDIGPALVERRRRVAPHARAEEEDALSPGRELVREP